MWKHTVVLIAALGILMLVAGGCPQRNSTAEPSTAQSEPAAAQPAATGNGIAWLKSLPEGKQAAQSQQKPVVIDFFADWCGPCVAMDEETWPNPEVAAAAAKFVAVRLDVDANQDVANEYGISGIPTVVVLDAGGKEVDRHVGFATPEELLKLLRKHSP
ncbi:MAG: thioredoxin family protein [Armatimonadetes bacterium]|nr:thioredoxin family protein [Armatimonadota bacterium]